MENQDEKKKPRAIVATQDDEHNTERAGLWVGLGAAAVVSIGVLALALYTDYQENKPAAPNTQAPVVIAGSVPVDENSAANVAIANSDNQVQGMTAPAEDHVSTPTTVVPEATNSPAATIIGQDVATDAKVIIEHGVVKFYFASGKADLAANANEALRYVVSGVQAGKKAVVSGYADSTGDVELNELLSKARAFNVRDALLTAGVPESHIIMQKPQSTTGSGAKDEARRVEVVLQ